MCWAKLWGTKVDRIMLEMMRATMLRAYCVPIPRLGAVMIITVKVNLMMEHILVKDKQCVKCYNGNCSELCGPIQESHVAI